MCNLILIDKVRHFPNNIKQQMQTVALISFHLTIWTPCLGHDGTHYATTVTGLWSAIIHNGTRTFLYYMPLRYAVYQVFFRNL